MVQNTKIKYTITFNENTINARSHSGTRRLASVRDIKLVQVKSWPSISAVTILLMGNKRVQKKDICTGLNSIFVKLQTIYYPALIAKAGA